MVGVAAPGFEQEHAGTAVLGQAVRQYATGGAGAHDDVVVLAIKGLNVWNALPPLVSAANGHRPVPISGSLARHGSVRLRGRKPLPGCSEQASRLDQRQVCPVAVVTMLAHRRNGFKSPTDAGYRDWRNQPWRLGSGKSLAATPGAVQVAGNHESRGSKPRCPSGTMARYVSCRVEVGRCFHCRIGRKSETACRGRLRCLLDGHWPCHGRRLCAASANCRELIELR